MGNKRRILFISLYNKIFASARYRVYNVAKFLKNNKKIFVKIIYLINPYQNTLIGLCHYYFSLLLIRFYYLWFDVIYMHKTHLSNFELFFLKKFFKKKIIISIDDLPANSMLNINPKFIDVVLCGSDYIQNLFSKRNFNAVFWPTTIPKNKLSYKKREKKYNKKNNNEVIIGWIGSSCGEYYIPPIITTLDKLRKQYTFKFKIVTSKYFINYYPEDILNRKYVIFEEWHLKNEWSYFDKIDILIMSLDDSNRSKAKGGFKILQAMFRGVVPVAYYTKANAYFITDGLNGFLYKNEKELEDKLELLLKNEDLREKFILNSYKILEEKKLYFEDKVEELWQYLRD